LFGGWRISILLDGGAMNVNVSRKMMVKMLKIKWLVGWMDGNWGEEQQPMFYSGVCCHENLNED
jgi:hypothetical protein